MSNTLKMAWLDIRTMKPALKQYLIFVGISIFFYVQFGVLMACITCGWGMALMGNSIFAVEEKNHLDRLYHSLPLTTKSIVRGRYLFVVLNYAAILALVSLLLVIVTMVTNQVFSVSEWLTGIAAGFLIFAFVTSAQLPLYYRFGYTKARYMSLLPFTFFFVLMLLPGGEGFLDKAVASLASIQDLLPLIGIAASALMLLLSMWISQRIVDAKRKRG